MESHTCDNQKKPEKFLAFSARANYDTGCDQCNNVVMAISKTRSTEHTEHGAHGARSTRSTEHTEHGAHGARSTRVRSSRKTKILYNKIHCLLLQIFVTINKVFSRFTRWGSKKIVLKKHICKLTAKSYSCI
jgi:hypothetical protein